MARMLIALVCLIGAAQAVSIPSWESGSRSGIAASQYGSSSDLCLPKTCHAQEKFAYEQGQTYVYSYDSQTKLAGKDQTAGPTVRLAARVEIAVAEPCRMILRLREVTVSGPVDQQLYKRQLEAEPLSFAFDDGKIEKICPSAADAEWVVNMKRAVLSALQVSPRTWDSAKSQNIREVDVIGTCDTLYEIQKDAAQQGRLWSGRSSSAGRIVVTKTKTAARCTDRNSIRSALAPRSAINMPLIAATYNCEQVIEDSLLQKVSCQDTNEVVSGQHGKVLSHLNLKFERKIAAKSSDLTAEHRGPASLLWAKNNNKINKQGQQYKAYQQVDEQTVAQTFRQLVDNMSNQVNEQTPEYYEELTAMLEQLPYEVVARFYQNVQRGQYGRQSVEKAQDIFLSALSDCQSVGCVKTLVQVIKEGQISATRATYYLAKLTFALGVDADEELVRELIPLVNYEKPVRQAFFAVANLASQLNDNSHVVQQVADAIAQHTAHKDETEAFAACKALASIGYYQGEAKETVLKVASGHYNQPDSVQAACIDALSYIADEQQVKETLFQIFQKVDESPEVRIAAYRTIMEVADERDVQKIAQWIERSERNTQVGSYVTSHWANLKETSHPQKQVVKQWVKNTDIKRSFPHNIRKYSENFELSAHPKLLQSGAALEADLIYNEQDNQIPTFMQFNTSAQLFGQEFQIVEMGIRQENLDSAFEELVQEITQGGELQLPELIKKVMQKLTLMKEQEQNSRRHHQQQQSSSRRQHQSNSDDVNMFWYLKVAGRTVMVLADEDFRGDSYGINWEQIFDKLQQGVKLDRAFAAKIVDAHYEIPTVSGMTLALDSNVTFLANLVADIKTDVQELTQILKGGNGQIKFHAVPSFVLQGAYSFGLESPEKKNQILVKNTIQSAPAFGFNLDVSQRKVYFTVDMPQQEIQLLKAQSRVYVVDQYGNEKEITARNNYKTEMCTEYAKQVLGVQLCMDAQAPRPVVNSKNPLWIGGPFSAEFTLKKHDSTLRKYELAIEAHQPGQNQKFLRAEFNTPGSQIDRQVKGELVLAQNPRTGLKEVTFEFRAPQNKQITGKANLQQTRQQVSSQITAQVNGQKKLQIQANIDQQENRQQGKTEFRPSIRAQFGSNSQPLVASGRVLVQQGRKQQVNIELKAGQKDEHQFSANLVQDGQIAQEQLRVAADIRAQTPALGQAQAHVTLERAQRSASISGDVQYKCAHRSCQKEQVRVAAKINNLSSGAMKKFNAHCEVSSASSPSKNLRADWNLIFKQGEHCENELNMAWGRNQQDKRNQLRLAHIVKKQVSGSRADRETTLEMTINALVGPANFDKQARIQTRVQLGETPKFHLQFNGQDNKQQEQRVDCLVKYELQSRSPLRIDMQAQLKSQDYDLSYSDNIQEVQPSEYKGKSIVNYYGRQTTVDYRFARQISGQDEQYKMEYELVTPSMKKQQHKTLVKYNSRRSQVEIQSETSKNGQRQLFLEAQYQPEEWQINAEVKRSNGKQYKATTRCQIDGQQQQIVSRLTKDGQQVYQVELKHDKQQKKATLEGEIKCTKTQEQYRIFAQAQAQKQFELQCQKNGKNVIRAVAQVQKDQSGKNFRKCHIEAEYSPLSRRQSTTYKIQSDLTNNKQVSSVEIFAHQDQKQVAFLKAESNKQGRQQDRQITVQAEITPLNKQRQTMKHKTQIQTQENKIEMESMTEMKGKTLYQAQATIRKEQQSRQQKQWQLNAQLKTQHNEYKTQNKVALNKQQKQVQVDCLCQQNGRQVVQAKIYIRPEGQSVVQIESPLCQADCQIDAQRNQAKIQVHFPTMELSHKTSALYNKRGQLDIESVTEKSGEQIMELIAELKQWAQSTLRIKGGKKYNLNALCDSERGQMKVDYKHRDHQWDMDFAGFGSEQMSLKANKLYKNEKRGEFNGVFSTSGKSVLRMETPAMYLDAQLAPWGQYRQSVQPEATLEFHQKNGRMIHHKTEIRFPVQQDQDQQMTLKSLHSVRGQQVFALDSLLSRKGLNMISMEIPQHQCRFEMNPFGLRQQAKFAQLQYQRSGPQPIDHQSRFEFAQNKIVIESRHLKNGAQWMTVDATLAKQGKNQIAIQAPHCDGKLQWTVYGQDNKAILLQINGKQFPLQHQTEIQYGNQQLTIESVQCETRAQRSGFQQVVCPKNKQTYKLSVQAQKDSVEKKIQLDAQYYGQQVVKAFANQEKKSRSGDKQASALVEFSPLTSSKTYKAVAEWNQERDQTVEAKVSVEKDGREILALQAQKQQVNSREQKIKVEAEYQTANARRPHKHTTLVQIKSDNQIQLQSETTLDGQRLYQGQCLIKKIDATRHSAQWELNCDMSTEQDRFETEGSIFWSKQQQIKVQAECKKNGQQALVVKADLQKRGESTLKLESAYQGKVQVQYDNKRQIALVQIDMPTQELSHETKVNWKRNQVIVDSLTQQQGEQLLKLFANLHKLQKSQLQITSQLKNFNLEAEFQPSQGKLVLDAQCEQNKYSVVCEGFGTEVMELKAYKIQQGQTHHMIESRIARRGQSHFNFDLKNFAEGKIRSDLFSGRKSFVADIQGKGSKYGFKHSTTFEQIRAGQPMTFATLHQDKRGRQVVKIEGQLVPQRDQVSKIALEIPTHQAELLLEPVMTSFAQQQQQQQQPQEHNMILTVKSKDGARRSQQFQHQTAIRVTPAQRIHIRSQHTVQGKPTIQVSGLFDRRTDMPSSLGYERGTTRVHFAVQPRGDRKIASAQLKDLIKGYNHSSALEYTPRTHFGLSTETERSGQQVMKMMANLDKDQSSSFELKSRLANADLYYDQVNNQMAWGKWANARRA